jgi:hypothetical protein
MYRMIVYYRAKLNLHHLGKNKGDNQENGQNEGKNDQKQESE